MRCRIHRLKIAFTTLALTLAAGPATAETKVVVLGTGVPTADYARAGAGIAVIHDGQAYLFDAGRGVVQRAVEASQRLGIESLEPTRINYLFITHLHSDHLHDYAELAGSRWWERKAALQTWGPSGLREMTNHAVAMLDVEARIRKAGTPQEAIPNPDGHRIVATDIEPGVVFRAENFVVEAFTVPHGDIRPAVGYRVTTPDRTIVISGDTSYSEEVARQAKGVDLLFHEVISADALRELPDYWQRYHSTSHTPTDQLVRLAKIARPGKLVLYHIIFLGKSEAEILAEVARDYDGEVALANDLDVF